MNIIEKVVTIDNGFSLGICCLEILPSKEVRTKYVKHNKRNRTSILREELSKYVKVIKSLNIIIKEAAVLYNQLRMPPRCARIRKDVQTSVRYLLLV